MKKKGTIMHNKLAIKVVIVFISLCQGLQFSISPVLEKIQFAFPSVNVSTIQMLITAPALFSIAMALLSGWLVIHISKKALLIFGTFILGICGFLPLLYENFIFLFLSRTALGIGLGIIIALNTAVVVEYFDGSERVTVLGLQGSSVGAGMLLSATLGGQLGSIQYQYAYFVHALGFVAALVIFFLLPKDIGKMNDVKEKIRINMKVFRLSMLMALEYLFLISFTTNIAMHLSGELKGSAQVAGLLTGVFSGVQIFAGLILRKINRFAGSYTLPVAMMSFALGCIFLILFPSSLFLLFCGAIFCGMSQGIFVPQSMFEVSNAVSPISVAMASACLTVAMCVSQFISPVILNTISRILFGKVITTGVYALAMICMALISIVFAITNCRKKI
jgi:predicted MFS family arabinose efflux permease